MTTQIRVVGGDFKRGEFFATGICAWDSAASSKCSQLSGSLLLTITPPAQPRCYMVSPKKELQPPSRFQTRNGLLVQLSHRRGDTLIARMHVDHCRLSEQTSGCRPPRQRTFRANDLVCKIARHTAFRRRFPMP